MEQGELSNFDLLISCRGINVADSEGPRGRSGSASRRAPMSSPASIQRADRVEGSWISLSTASGDGAPISYGPGAIIHPGCLTRDLVPGGLPLQRDTLAAAVPLLVEAKSRLALGPAPASNMRCDSASRLNRPSVAPQMAEARASRPAWARSTRCPRGSARHPESRVILAA